MLLRPIHVSGRDILAVTTGHVETVVLLSHRKADDYVEVEIDTDDFPITSVELKATYTDIQDYVMNKYGIKITSLEVAQMKQKDQDYKKNARQLKAQEQVLKQEAQKAASDRVFYNKFVDSDPANSDRYKDKRGLQSPNQKEYDFEIKSAIDGSEENQDRIKQVNDEIDYYQNNKSSLDTKSGQQIYEDSISEKTHNDRLNKNQQEQNNAMEEIKKGKDKIEQKLKEINELKNKMAEQRKQLDDSQINTNQQLNDLNILLRAAQNHLDNLNEHQRQMTARVAALSDMEKYLKSEAEKASKARDFYNKFVKPRRTK